jgi:metal-dependent amidase/aminoacylase/carboxypeptidase family protein
MNQEIVKFRQEIHKHPEVSNDEYNSSERVTNYVKKFNPDEIIESRINIFYTIYKNTLRDD